jgi:CubicO group peptidase (beta-lactamase class C family)
VGQCVAGTETIRGYRRGRPTPPWTFGALEGAGALRSTVADLLTFARACIGSPGGPIGEAIILSRRPVLRGRWFGGTGLGWQLRTHDRKKRPVEVAWHNGGTYGGSAFLAVDVPRSIAVVSVGNAGPRIVPPLDGPSWALFDDLAG